MTMARSGAPGQAQPPPSLQAPLWRAIAVFRLAALAYVAVLVVSNVDPYAHPTAGWLVLALMAGWTVFTWWAYARPARRRWPLLVADLVVTAALEITSLWVVGRAALDDGAPTLAVAWLAGPVLAWAVAGGRRLGVVAALLLGDGGPGGPGRAHPGRPTGMMLMLLAAVAVGHVARLAVEAEQRLQRRRRAGGRHPRAGAAGPRHPRLGAAGAGAGAAPRRAPGRARPASWPGWPASRRRRCAR